MTARRSSCRGAGTSISPNLLAVLAAALLLPTRAPALDLPAELPLWKTPPPGYRIPSDVREQVRYAAPSPGSPSGLNRGFSSVASPTYSIHRPRNPNGVGLVICPGGGFRDVWLDREGHDLALWLKDRNVTCLVLKYRTYVADDKNPASGWRDYQRAVEADGRQAIRILRREAANLDLQPDKIGICGFSAGGQLALRCALSSEPEQLKAEVSGMPDFAGLFYPGIPDDVGQVLEGRDAPDAAPRICPIFVVNARDDGVTPADKCLDFYRALLRAGVNAELHVFGKGGHGFDLGTGRGRSAAIWPTSFVAWLRDSSIIQD